MARNDGSVPRPTGALATPAPAGAALNGKASPDDAALERELASLRASAPSGLVDAVLRQLRLPGGSQDATRQYVRVEAGSGDLYVVYGEAGISHVFAVALAGETPAAFEAVFLAEVGERVRPGTKPPAGLARAVRSGDARGLSFDYGTLTPFQRAVLEKALEIPAGEVRPYGWIAREIGHPKAVRAVGTALGNNPIPVLIPCHRVVRSDGLIGNYGMGGSRKKRELLTQEGVDVDRLERLASAGVHVVGSDTTHVFCHPTCRDARRITPQHLVRFRDASAAESAGYRPCEHCRPAAVAAQTA